MSTKSYIVLNESSISLLPRYSKLTIRQNDYSYLAHFVFWWDPDPRHRSPFLIASYS